MSKKLLSILVVLLSLTLFAPSAVAQVPLNTDECGAYCNTERIGTTPFAGQLFCFYIEQARADGVPFFIYQNGVLINEDPTIPGQPKPLHRQVKQSSDHYCIGAHYITRATEIVICNRGWSITLIAEAIQRYIAAGDRSEQRRSITICLMEAGECVARLSARGVPA